MQRIIVLIIVALAVFAVIRRVLRKRQGGAGGCGCGKGKGCGDV